MNALVPLSPQHAMSIAQAFATAKMVPQHFKQSVGDCYIAVTMAHRFNMDVFLLMQELFIINGRPMLSGKLTAAICNHNLAEPLTPTYFGEGNNRKITIVGRVAGRDPQSIEVTVAQVRTSNEQWQKNPDQMLFYAGSRMWARRYTPDLVLGIMFDDEAEAVEAPKPTLQNLLAIQKPAEKELIDPTTGEVVEHVDPIKIEMNEGSSWGQFIEPLQRYIASARSIDEVDQWMMLNQDLLLKLREAKPQLYKLFEKNIEPTKERLANQ
jgi:hypothetical protein